ncbi:MerR family DNA-binding transcriptional regulator [Micromonospora sp. C41]|uniref:MerR family DNA-binding transcriptional regulator n=1 Tax=Micromonospora sp. C41 TaxID=2824878 RepID=UPI0035B02436
MRIGELSARTGVSARSIRYYEQQGLLAALRTPSGQRVFAESAWTGSGSSSGCSTPG